MELKGGFSSRVAPDERHNMSSLDFYTFGKQIGEGAYGKVKVGTE